MFARQVYSKPKRANKVRPYKIKELFFLESYCKRAWAEVHLDRLKRNIQTIRQNLPQNTQIMAVVKADAYGHGETEILSKLTSCGIKYFAVSNLNEAVSVRKHCSDGEILILGYTPPECAGELIRYNIIQGIVSSEYAAVLSANAKDGRKIRCHIKIDTGMGRVGIKNDTPKQSADEAARIIRNCNGLCVEGIYTHFAVADSDDTDDIEYTKKQSDFVTGTYDELVKLGIKLEHLHFLNSAGACYYKNERSTLARIGITMYGLYPNPALELPYSVEPVMDFKAVISEIKTIHKGDCVSYGRTYCAEKDTVIATVTVGYADGYSRLLSSKADILVRGHRCPVIGRICMDQLMIDISGINDDIHAGETVTLIGSDGTESITADDLAGLYGTIGYEVVCGISKRVPRIYYY